MLLLEPGGHTFRLFLEEGEGGEEVGMNGCAVYNAVCDRYGTADPNAGTCDSVATIDGLLFSHRAKQASLLTLGTITHTYTPTHSSTQCNVSASPMPLIAARLVLRLLH